MHEQLLNTWYRLLDVADGKTPIGGIKLVIYCIRCIETQHEYVGQTKGFLRKRLTWHIIDAFKRKRQSEFVLPRALRKHGLEAFEVCLLEVVADKSMLNDAEKKHVEQRRTYVDGYNMTLGGDGFSGRPLPERAKAQLRKPVQQLDAETGDIIAEFDSVSAAVQATGIPNITYACQGRINTAGGYKFRFVNSEDAERGRWSEAAREAGKLRSHKGFFAWKSVEQFDLTTNETIAIFPSMKEAVATTRILNVSMVCRGVRKSAGGFGWRFAEQPFESVPAAPSVSDYVEIIKKYEPRPRKEAKPKVHKLPRWQCPNCDLDFGQPNVFHRHTVDCHGFTGTAEELYCAVKSVQPSKCACGCGQPVDWHGWAQGYSKSFLSDHDR